MSNAALALLTQRNSAAKLVEPAPSDDELEWMWQAALRAPDHAWLTPWRFLTISGPARQHLGELFAEAARARQPDLDEEQLDRFRRHPLRAPLLIAVIARLQEHPKVPEQEQLLSAGCAAYALLLAAEAQGYAGIWRTGDNAYDERVAAALGLGDNERLIAWLYIGTREGNTKTLPARPVDQFVQVWSGAAEGISHTHDQT